MRALRRVGGRVDVFECEAPSPAFDEVRVRVAVAGVCRTDRFVAEGKLASPDALTLGHEASGVIDAVGSSVDAARVGQRVALWPFAPCGECAPCVESRFEQCERPSMLGLDRDGAFADAVCVPASCAYVVPRGLDARGAAYAEPVAAAMAVLNSGVQPSAPVLLLGRNRISALTEIVLRTHGFREITTVDEAEAAALREGSFRQAIESHASEAMMTSAARALGVGGLFLLKSRAAAPVAMPLRALVRKQLTLRGALYGPFAQALGWIARHRAEVEALLEEELVDVLRWREAFSRDAEGETRKVMLSFDQRMSW